MSDPARGSVELASLDAVHASDPMVTSEPCEGFEPGRGPGVDGEPLDLRPAHSNELSNRLEAGYEPTRP
jgi:hypothetical protein